MPGSVPPVGDEREGLMAYLEQQRHVLRVAAYGLTDEQARATPTTRALSVGGLIKHCAAMERSWMDTVLERKRDGATAFPLLAAAENWPVTPWLQPWQPKET